MVQKYVQNLGMNKRQMVPPSVSQTITKTVIAPSINLDTLKARRRKIDHGKVTNINMGNKADVFKN